MKPLSKLHQETITKAKTEQDKVKAAAIAMIETPMEMIKAILLKHETAVIEVMRELEQAKQDTVKAEREAYLRHIKKLKKQRTWVGLTDEEMHECWDSPLTPLGMKHARMIEAKLKEKNT